MRIYHWKKGSFCDEAEFHQWVKQHLVCGNVYGDNLDALYDVLTSVQDVTVFVSLGWDSTLGKRAKTIRRVLQDATEVNPGLVILAEQP